MALSLIAVWFLIGETHRGQQFKAGHDQTLLVKSSLNRVPSGVTRDGARAEQNVRAFAGVPPRAHPKARRFPEPYAPPSP
jgi:hypothetical protein